MELSLKNNEKEQFNNISQTNSDNLKESIKKDKILNYKKHENNFILQYSPRTKYSSKLDKEEEMYNDLKQNFDPITIKILKKHFKERLGILKKEEMIAILKNHLYGFMPKNPKREKYLVKLLSKLFSDIDLNDTGDLDWNDFTNYIIHLSGKEDKSKSNISHNLKYYSKSNINISHLEINESIAYSFYIEKFNVIGIVEENKSYIKFFDANTCKKNKKYYIDLREVQTNVDLVEYSILNEKANRLLLKEEEEKKIKKNFMEREKMALIYPNKTVLSSIFHSGRRAGLALENKGGQTILQFLKKRKEEKSGIIENFDILNKIDINFKSQNKKLSVLCTCFIPEFDILLISSTNNTITTWQFSKNEIRNVNSTSEYKLSKFDLKIAILIANHPQYTMIWDSQKKCLYTGQKDGKILKWVLTNPNPLIYDTLDINIIKKKLEKININKKDNAYKDDANNIFEKYKKIPTQFKEKINLFLEDDKKNNFSVSSLIILKKLKLLAASYYNGCIVLWDTLLKEYRKFYYDQTTGIYSMLFDSIHNLLFTSGFSHDIYVYDPYIDNNCVFKLLGHSCSIKYIQLNEKENELMSLDILGNIKIWDITTLSSFQNIKINEEDEDNSKKKQQLNKKQKVISSLKMIYLEKLKKLFIFGDKMLFYETDRSNFPDSADDHIICSCYYDYSSLNLISFCLRKIKFWNLLTGKIRFIYNDPMGCEMTAIAVDKSCKRAYLGDNTGRIKNINLRTGLLLKNLESHNSEIKFLIHSQELNLLVSCSNDNIIKIHKDQDLTKTEVIKEIRIIDNNVTALCFLNKFSRLSIGLSNGILKFYDIEHYHYDSDLEADSSLIKKEITFIKQLEDLEIILCCYTNGICKFIVTPPSNAKYKIIYEFNNDETNNNISITSLEFDNINHHIFIGDILGYINCYDISSIYEIVKELSIKNNKNILFPQPIIMKDNLYCFKNININKLWRTEAHKESIRHIHYINIEPRIIITTSYDLKIKIFSANNGEYKDEFKQISNRTKPVPIGIKYYILDPFGEEDTSYEPKYIYRKDISNFNFSKIIESNGQPLAEVAKKITEYNAKEKLWIICKNNNLPGNMSNDWKLDINIEKIKEKKEEEYKNLLNKVNELEKITKITESIILNHSIYADSYRPKYIEEMNDINKIKELTNTIKSRLRSVKLAVIKANTNYTKMIELTNKQKIKSKNFIKEKPKNIKYNGVFRKSLIEKNNNKLSSFDSISTILNKNNKKDSEKKLINFDEKEQNKSNSQLRVISAFSKNEEEDKKKIIPLRNIRPIFPELKSKYALDRTKLKTPGDIFNKYQSDFTQGYREIFKPFKKLIRKTKDTKKHIIRVKSSIVSNKFQKRFFSDDIKNEKEYDLNKKNKINILEKHLKQLEKKNSSL